MNDAINDTARTKRISNVRNNWRESMMKRPEKRRINKNINSLVAMGNILDTGFNKGLFAMEAYYKQHIKENYIKKPSMENLVKTMWSYYKKHNIIVEDRDILEGIAKSIIKQIRGER